jgi:hypothetical protein
MTGLESTKLPAPGCGALLEPIGRKRKKPYERTGKKPCFRTMYPALLRATMCIAHNNN